jgi:hypothetical protein
MTVAEASAAVAYALGGLLLLGEASVHAEQFVTLFSGVPWIGPLFIANAVACVVTFAGLAVPRGRRLAALAGAGISVVALVSLVVSYGRGLFGWQEIGFRTEIALALVTEAGAVAALSAALALPVAARSHDFNHST